MIVKIKHESEVVEATFETQNETFGSVNGAYIVLSPEQAHEIAAWLQSAGQPTQLEQN